MTLLLMGIYAVVTFALAAYTWSHREQNFLIIKKPTPGLTRFLKLFVCPCWHCCYHWWSFLSALGKSRDFGRWCLLSHDFRAN